MKVVWCNNGEWIGGTRCLEEVGPTFYGKLLARLLREANKDETQEPNVHKNFNNKTLIQ